jgi:hypothetical protein
VTSTDRIGGTVLVGTPTSAVALGAPQRDGSGMDAVRCLECGATRWTMTRAALAHLVGEPCELCGGETVIERRHPGTGAGRPAVERRDVHEPEPA